MLCGAPEMRDVLYFCGTRTGLSLHGLPEKLGLFFTRCEKYQEKLHDKFLVLYFLSATELQSWKERSEASCALQALTKNS